MKSPRKPACPEHRECNSLVNDVLVLFLHGHNAIAERSNGPRFSRCPPPIDNGQNDAQLTQLGGLPRHVVSDATRRRRAGRARIFATLRPQRGG
jgi:hypothetical protein